METAISTKTVRQSLREFYDNHDFGEDGGMGEKYAWIKFGFFSVPIPNFKSRRDNVYLHDVSHIVTGYDTTWKGESAVSAWEIATGGWNRLYIPWLLTLWAMGLGILFYTQSTVSAFRKGLTMRNALTCGLTKQEIYRLTVAELQKELSDKPRSNKRPFLWSAISLLVFFMPFILVLLGVLLFIKLF
jgi:hypothetical protein